MDTVLFVYNPFAGRPKIGKDVADLINSLKNEGFKVELWSTAEDGKAEEAGIQASEGGYDCLIVMGGDGTIHQVINGLAEQQHLPKLGIIPSGTTNDFSNHFGIPPNPRNALKVILKNKVCSVDLGKINNKYILYVVAGGCLPSASYQATKAEKRILGKFAYFMHGAKNILSYKPFHLKVTSKEVEFEDCVSLFIIGNTSCLGGIKDLIPGADPSDGLFDVLIISSVDIPEALEIADHILNKGLLTHPKITTFSTKNLKAASNDLIQLSYDGEAGDFLPVEFEVVPQKIKLLIP